VTRFQILACLAIALGTTAAAAQTAPKPVSRADFIKIGDGQFSGADTNHDGFMSRAELAAQQERDLEKAKANLNQQFTAKFNQLDTNHDGKLSLQEFLAAVPQLKIGEPADQMIARLDTNHDGRISAEEFRNSRLAAFNRLDANHDGILTPQESQGK
jgi:Ca2+-binding EF-hand superfamily protein